MPSSDDVFEGDQCRIKVNPSGGYFHLYRAGDISEIDLLDMATAISKQCRFTGHLIEGASHYSVAEHSVLVAQLIKEMGGTPQQIFFGLMHDTCEAYLSDIAAPFKRELGQYYDKEALIWERIAKKFGLSGVTTDDHILLKKADWYALFIEARQIVCQDEEDLKTWNGYEDHGQESLQFKIAVNCWDPNRARVEFLIRFALCMDAILGGTE
jgi:uncharacterized protein